MIAAVLAGGAIGAVLRFFLERQSVHRFGERIPYGTLLANVLGAFVLGAAVGMHERAVLSDAWLAFIGTGVCGALTTFSGFIGQIYTRARHADTRNVAIGYLAVTFALGIAAAWLGYSLLA